MLADSLSSTLTGRIIRCGAGWIIGVVSRRHVFAGAAFVRRVRGSLPGAEAGKHDLSHVIDRFGKAVGEFFERCGDIFQTRFSFVGSRQKESGSRNEDRCRQSED